MKKVISALLILGLMLTLCACGAAPAKETAAPAAEVPAAETQTEETSAPGAAPADEAEPTATVVTDLVGREVEISRPGSFERVVCIGAGALRVYCYVGDVSLLCGVEDIDNTTLEDRPRMFDSVARPYVLAYGDTFAALPSCGVGGPNAQTAEAEKILSCEPDIVISEYEDAQKSDALQQQLGVPVITVRTGQSGVLDESFRTTMALLGTVFAREDRAEALLSFIDAETADIAARTADLPEEGRPGAYICGLGNWGTTNHLMTSQRYAAFDLAGIRNVVTGLSANGPQALEAEKFTALGEEMDVMILDAAAVKNIRPLLEEDGAIFDACRAWQNGEVYLQMAYNAYYTNCEIALINAWYVAKCVYPELFEDIDMTAKTDEITEAFLGQKLAEAIFACPASFGGYQKIDPAAFFG